MELDFDKEIDALLRRSGSRAGPDAPVTAASAASNHLDADEIAAFAENAVPAPTRLIYVGHLADCSQCRRELGFALSFQSESVDDGIRDAAPAKVESTPSYLSLFTAPWLAAAFGALILVLGGSLILTTLRDRDGVNVAQVFDTDAASNANSNQAAASANVVLPSTANANADTAANSASNSTAAAVPQSPTASGRADTAANTNAALKKESFSVDGMARSAIRPADAAPPPPTVSVTDSMAGAPIPESARKADDRDEAAKLAERQQNRNRDALLASPKQKSGPSRNQAQSQVPQNSTNNLLRVEPSSSRRISGRTFNRRDGVWYDAAFNGQPTTDVRRGTDAFRKLDGAVRNIANSLDGVVVVVWKARAYRIQ